MYLFRMTNDEERVVRLALEEFMERRRKYTAHNACDAQHVADRTTARECLFNLRCTVPINDVVPTDESR